MHFIKSLSIVLLLLSETLYSQPFSSIEASFNFSNPLLLDDHYANKWSASDAYFLSLQTPYYQGILEARIQIYDYISKSDAYADFKSINVLLSNNYSLNLINSFNISLGIGTGIQRLSASFTEFRGEKSETEFLIFTKAEPVLEFQPFSVYTSLEYRKVFHLNRQNIVFIGIGIRKSFKLPEAIVEFID